MRQGFQTLSRRRRIVSGGPKPGARSDRAIVVLVKHILHNPDRPSGAAWESGISVANYEWMSALVLLLSAIFVAPVFIRQRLTSIPELMEQRFDIRLRNYLSGSTLFLSIVLDTAGSL